MGEVEEEAPLLGCCNLRRRRIHNFLSQWGAGPCEYSILDSYSIFFVLLELDSDQTLLGPSSE